MFLQVDFGHAQRKLCDAERAGAGPSGVSHSIHAGEGQNSVPGRCLWSRQQDLARLEQCRGGVEFGSRLILRPERGGA